MELCSRDKDNNIAMFSRKKVLGAPVFIMETATGKMS